MENQGQQQHGHSSGGGQNAEKNAAILAAASSLGGFVSPILTSPSSPSSSSSPHSPHKPKLKYKNWCAQVEKKSNAILLMMPQLELIGSTEERKREKAAGSLGKANGLLQDMITLLEIVTYKPSKKQPPALGDMAPEMNTSSSSLKTSGGMPAPQSQQQGSSQSLSSSGSRVPPLQTASLSSSFNDLPVGGGLISTFNSLKEQREKEAKEAAAKGDANANGKNSRIISQSCREAMLTLWGSLINFAEKNYNLDKDFSLVYRTILLLVGRKEFDTAISSIDPQTYKRWTADFLTKYRVKLYKTFTFVAYLVSSTPYLNLQLSQFCAKFLVISYHRIPRVAKQLLAALTPPESETEDILKYYPCPTKSLLTEPVLDRPDKLPFHSLLMQHDACEKELESISQGWLNNLARKESVFFLFVREWINMTKCALGENVDFRSVPGYFSLVYAVLHEIKCKEQVAPPPPPAKPTPSAEAHIALIHIARVETRLLDAMVKVLFLKTCVFDLELVAATLSIVELWIREYGILPNSFDIDFFCKGIDSIISADHHQLIIRSLNMVYNVSDSFQGRNRRALFSDLLFHKCFNQLFLHWDQPVRNAYHHILLYRMVRINRGILNQRGFTLAEYSKLTHNNTVLTTTKQLAPIKYPEREKERDDKPPAVMAASSPDLSLYNTSSRLASSAASISKPPGTPRPVNLPTVPIRKVRPPVPPRRPLTASQEIESQTATVQQESCPTSGEDHGAHEDDHTSVVASSLSCSSDDKDMTHAAATQASDIFVQFGKEYAIDVELFLKIELNIKNVSDQFRSPDLKHYDLALNNYVAPSLSEFKTYIAISNQVNSTPPKIIPLILQGPTPLNFLKD
ncbi:hypothetical protein SAMD00019534_088830 [Acytostelium subglobosum LB1]|uniref:hypothetical protein n=1 Tax=Acytostelium subglobosum LB1 TaxID=1410327 RepID=UPI00064491DD|nr:hypothetical protein SAMD00019534_088830 [Acytostelium subglobosum LB1]GAM25708.1 hypothetical protein SAMD00019534_088830 [Acytostelium subglobosum LB1]|eukprot:XP_012751226.1 hypothetical protein SAMD00019534_088830 [Acytostelium subglobosum LB1]